MSVIVYTEHFSLMSASDPSLGEHVWSAALYASPCHPHVACQVNIEAGLVITLS